MRVELSTKLNTVTSTQLIQYAGLLHMSNCECVYMCMNRHVCMCVYICGYVCVWLACCVK